MIMYKFKKSANPLAWLMTLAAAFIAGCGGGIQSDPAGPSPVAHSMAMSPTTTAADKTTTIYLGEAGNFVVLSKSGISSVPHSVLTGDIGVSPIALTAVTGFAVTQDASTDFATSTQVNGKIYAADLAPARMTQAITDMEAAYDDAASRTPDPVADSWAGEIGGRTVPPGVYRFGSGLLISTDVTLEGDANAVWIFQVAGTMTQASATRVLLSGGAQAKNIFWVPTGVVAIGTSAHLEGIVLAKSMISMNTGATANGRLYAQTAVTLQMNKVTQPEP